VADRQLRRRGRVLRDLGVPHTGLLWRELESRRRISTPAAGAVYARDTGWFCTIVGNLLVCRDNSHITVSYADYLSLGPPRLPMASPAHPKARAASLR
jgi:hypothetical protein